MKPRSLISLALSTVLALTPMLATATAPKVLHLGVVGLYDQVDLDQFKRMDAQLKEVNKDRVIVSSRNKPTRAKFDKEPQTLREVGINLTARLSGSDEMFDQVIIQAEAEDYAYFWFEFDHGRLLLEGLRGHLTPNARIILTGGPALGQLKASDGEPTYQTRVPALLEALGVPNATLVAAVSPVHLHAPTSERIGQGITTAIGVALMAAGGVAISYIPREQTWIDYMIPVGGFAWMGGAVAINLLVERLTDPTYDLKEAVGVDKVFNFPQLLVGLGITALAGGLYYSGSGLLDQTFAVWTAGYAAALVTGYVVFEKGDQVLAFLRREKAPLNEGRAIVRRGTQFETSNVKMDDPSVYSCAGLLNGEGTGLL